MNLAQAIDPITMRFKTDSTLVYIDLSIPDTVPKVPKPQTAPRGRQQPLSAPVLKALAWLRMQNVSKSSADVRLATGISNQLIGSVFQRLLIRRLIVRTGKLQSFKYRAVPLESLSKDEAMNSAL